MKKLILLLISASLTFAVTAQKAAKKQEPQAIVLKSKEFEATWTGNDEKYTFNKNKTSQVVIDGRICPGTWALEDKTLTITPKKLMWKKDDPCSKTKVLEVISVTANGLQVIESAGKKELHLTRQKQSK